MTPSGSHQPSTHAATPSHQKRRYNLSTTAPRKPRNISLVVGAENVYQSLYGCFPEEDKMQNVKDFEEAVTKRLDDNPIYTSANTPQELSRLISVVNKELLDTLGDHYCIKLNPIHIQPDMSIVCKVTIQSTRDLDQRFSRDGRLSEYDSITFVNFVTSLAEYAKYSDNVHFGKLAMLFATSIAQYVKNVNSLDTYFLEEELESLSEKFGNEIEQPANVMPISHADKIAIVSILAFFLFWYVSKM